MKKAEKTKRLIIEKSAQLFNLKGYVGTSMQNIADVAGVTKGSIYGNFTSKDEIAGAAFEYNVQLLFRELWDSMDAEISAKAKLKAYCDFHRNNYKQILEYGGCPILNCAIDTDDTHEKLNKKVAQTLQNWEQSLASIIQLGKEQQEFKKDVNATYFAGLIISLVEGNIMLAKTHKNDSYIINGLQHIEQLIQSLYLNH